MAADGALRPLDPALQHHAYGGVEHRTTEYVDGYLLAPYRKDDDA